MISRFSRASLPDSLLHSLLLLALVLVWAGTSSVVLAQIDDREMDYDALLKEGLQRGGTVLNLSGKKIGDKGLVWLLQRTSELSKVKKLDLRYNELTEKAGVLLAETKALPQLKELQLLHNFLMDNGTTALSKAQGLDKVEKLGLGFNEVRDQGALAISESKSFPKLKKLDLRGNYLADATKQALKKNLGHLKSLKLEARL